MTGVKYDMTGQKYKVYGTKKDAEQARLDNFEQSRKNKTKANLKKAPFAVKVGGQFFISGAGKTAQFFTDKVLSSSKSKKNIGYTRSEFANLSLEQQSKVYEKYMESRMSGKTDAYGNVNPNYGKDDVPRKTQEQIEKENKEAEDGEGEVKISEEEYKKRRGLKGSRSMFGYAGGRGYFDTV